MTDFLVLHAKFRISFANIERQLIRSSLNSLQLNLSSIQIRFQPLNPTLRVLQSLVLFLQLSLQLSRLFLYLLQLLGGIFYRKMSEQAFFVLRLLVFLQLLYLGLELLIFCFKSRNGRFLLFFKVYELLMQLLALFFDLLGGRAQPLFLVATKH